MNPIVRWTARERGLHPSGLVTIGVLVLLALVQNHGDPLTTAFNGFSLLWLVLFTMLLGGGLIATEVDSGHAQLLLSRPITRAQLVLGRFGGAALVLIAGATLAWLASEGAAVVRGQFTDAGPRILVLPLALVPALGWLAALTALSTVLTGWTNAGVLIGARVASFLISRSVHFVTANQMVNDAFAAVDSHFGPQDLAGVARQVANGDHVLLEPILWSVFWLFGSLLAAVVLFNRRELARRRG